VRERRPPSLACSRSATARSRRRVRDARHVRLQTGTAPHRKRKRRAIRSVSPAPSVRIVRGARVPLQVGSIHDRRCLSPREQTSTASRPRPSRSRLRVGSSLLTAGAPTPGLGPRSDPGGGRHERHNTEIHIRLGGAWSRIRCSVSRSARRWRDSCPVALGLLSRRGRRCAAPQQLPGPKRLLELRAGAGWAPGELIGVWAGTSTFQRRQPVRICRRSECPMCGPPRVANTEDSRLCLSCGMSRQLMPQR
jgi:hypothetical protein